MSFLYSVLLEYAGGTYVSQVVASSPKDALVKWTRQLDASVVWGMGKKSLEILRDDMREETPVPLTGLNNIWCTDALIRGKGSTIHVVQTVQ